MRHGSLVIGMGLLALGMLACSEPATQEQIDEMCNHLMYLKGYDSRTSVETELATIKKEYEFKEQKLKDDLARDEKGYDDVLTQKISKIEKDPELEAEEKEEQIAAAREDTATKKQPLREQLEKDLTHLGFKKNKILEDTKIEVTGRKERLDKTLAECLAQAGKEELTAEKVQCRIDAVSEKVYDSCK
jgi:hypothetical protein